MKKRKSFIGMVLLVAVFMLAIGYAAIGDIDFSITGSASATTSDENFKVKFDNTAEITTTKTVSANTTATITPAITDDHNATLSVSGLTTTNDVVTATYTIKNDSPELSATLTVGTITPTNNEYFEITALFGTGDDAATTMDIAHGETTTLTVTVKLVKTPTDDVSTNLTIPFTASPVE